MLRLYIYERKFEVFILISVVSTEANMEFLY